EGEGRIGHGSCCCEQDDPSFFLTPPALKFLPGGVAVQRGTFDIVHARPLQRLVRQVEASRLDEIDLSAETGGQPQDRARIARDVRLVKRDAKPVLSHPAFNCDMAATGLWETWIKPLARRGQYGYKARVFNCYRRRATWKIRCSFPSCGPG